MSSAAISEAPIYDRLVEERGDVPAETRRIAEETQREVARAVDFSAVRASAARRAPHGLDGP
ncbi:hypothetical protein [Streptomyces chattanoogensis]|uniref:Uncharacterized protein n=1 Tax=Streptomyces chattanoogensis TaxID=66876 RepID=A0A0N0XZQ1_9ACTN|nr:hypothetical protein [Streptomyces chattanoogensis]KPC65084.1 hypothetical protein ADL29_08535 [Streptomyces chattanoogensis]